MKHWSIVYVYVYVYTSRGQFRRFRCSWIRAASKPVSFGKLFCEDSNIFVRKVLTALFDIIVTRLWNFFARKRGVGTEFLPTAGTVDWEITDCVEVFLLRHVWIVLSSLSLRLLADRNVPIDDAIIVEDVTAVWIGRIC